MACICRLSAIPPSLFIPHCTVAQTLCLCRKLAAVLTYFVARKESCGVRLLARTAYTCGSHVTTTSSPTAPQCDGAIRGQSRSLRIFLEDKPTDSSWLSPSSFGDSRALRYALAAISAGFPRHVPIFSPRVSGLSSNPHLDDQRVCTALRHR